MCSSDLDLVRKSRKCVLPPKLNFVNFRDNQNNELLDESQYDTLPPFAMYIFEFSADLSRQDVSNIWQGVSPSLTDVSEFQSINIEHPIEEREVLNPVNLSLYGNKLPENTRFKIFKVKTKGMSSYEELQKKTIGERATHRMSFNWPYDFFSLVEMAKVDVELSFVPQQENQE